MNDVELLVEMGFNSGVCSEALLLDAKGLNG